MTPDGPQRLPGGRDQGAFRSGELVHRAGGAWSADVFALLRHLQERGFTGAPRPVRRDVDGEVLTHLPGETIGERSPWPAWTHSDTALRQVAEWLARYHRAVADHRPSADARWREQHATPGPDVIVAHNDAAPYNAVWTGETLVGFVDWDMAGPRQRLDDVAWTAFAWVPLHARRVVEAEGFTAFEDRRRRLQLFADVYTAAFSASEGCDGSVAPASVEDLLTRLDRVLADHIRLVRARAELGDPAYERMVALGRLDDLDDARRGLADV